MQLDFLIKSKQNLFKYINVHRKVVCLCLIKNEKKNSRIQSASIVNIFAKTMLKSNEIVIKKFLKL